MDINTRECVPEEMLSGSQGVMRHIEVRPGRYKRDLTGEQLILVG